MTFRTIVTDYTSQRTAIRAVRDDVFLREQGISPELEHDEYDERCLHAVVFADQQPVATGRLDLEKNGKVGRVAVLSEFRRCGLGTRVMQSLELAGVEHSLKKIWFHAQVSAVPFYFSLGYQIVGPEFEEAGIAHRLMEKSLCEK